MGSAPPIKKLPVVLGLWITLTASAAFAAGPSPGWKRVDIPSTSSYFFRYVPQSLDPGHPAPVVLFFHGSGTKPFDYQNFVQDAAERARCVVALPKSDSSLGWGTGDDDQTVAETLRLLREEMAVDPSHIAVAGHSAGGAYAYLLAYTTRSGFSAVFSLAAHYYAVNAVADPDYKAPIRMFYGTADPNYTGGSYDSLKQQWIRLGVSWEEDIRPGAAHGDLPADAMAAGFLFLAGKSYSSGAPTGTCVPGPSTLCLRDGRFRVEITWRDFSGGSGNGVEPGDAGQGPGRLLLQLPLLGVRRRHHQRRVQPHRDRHHHRRHRRLSQSARPFVAGGHRYARPGLPLALRELRAWSWHNTYHVRRPARNRQERRADRGGGRAALCP
jgi:predicted esterase